MGSLFGELLTPALGVILGPMPLIALVLFLTAAGGRGTAWAYVLGALLSLLGVTAAVTFLGDSQSVDQTGSTASQATSAIKLLLGVLLLVLAVRQWRDRPRAGELAPLPGWMSALDTMTPVVAFGLGAVMMGLSPKTLPMSASAGLSIAQTGLADSAQWVAIVVYVLLACAGFLVIVAISLVMGKRGDAMLGGVKDFLVQNYNVIMTMLFLLLGFHIAGAGITGLFS